ncbi:hypothetical protein M430DRAFT_54262 [Amorphotheca resinae ATCC 22711]|jgi:hypothetical protein|uniref:Uncharacterized protein n=1 Tax=Amorphotheca resinae ATCC 22711 TaxID=857342 RepID=A0A2T3APN6_AMORE|nr:hypothetical protein M430DRAFT_54262 [Amorphotheca resinae ATCC 22711]PSS06967.1 hypothetical protein M430DRAFT_54262 [Amorphotheca resinae ATCC 22711]
MPSKGKSKAKASKGPSKPSTSSTIDPPAPFTRPSRKLDEFLTKLSKQHIYITHIDSKPEDFKKKIFMVPVLMNLLIMAGIFWRIRTIGPFYMKMCSSLMGRFNETTIDTNSIPWQDSVREVLRRTGIFMIDLLIYVFIWPWPRDFFAGRAIGNPVTWRFIVGFRDKEIVVRRSRRWDLNIGNVLDEDSEGSRLAMDNVRKAVDPIWMSERTGYLMLNREWDLDWKAMIQATKLVDKKTISLDDFKTTVLIHHDDFGWMAIESASAGGSAKEEEGRRKIIAFKDELTAIGKENLFFRWIELVQFESSGPDGFGPEQQRKTMAKAKEMFEAQGVDFDEFWKKIGGMEGMPGMDES